MPLSGVVLVLMDLNAGVVQWNRSTGIIECVVGSCDLNNTTVVCSESVRPMQNRMVLMVLINVKSDAGRSFAFLLVAELLSLDLLVILVLQGLYELLMKMRSLTIFKAMI